MRCDEDVLDVGAALEPVVARDGAQQLEAFVDVFSPMSLAIPAVRSRSKAIPVLAPQYLPIEAEPQDLDRTETHTPDRRRFEETTVGTGPGRRRGLRDALRLQSTLVKLDEKQLDALRAQCADEMREKLAHAGDKHVGDVVQQANDSYLEQDRRAQRAETRAATILTAASPLMGLVATVGTLQLRSSGPAPLPLLHRFVVAAFIAFILIPLILAARYALEVTTTQHGWSRPDSWPLVASRAGLDEEFTVQTLAALGVAAQYNAVIGDWKFERLGLARRMFALGLLMLLVHPLSLLLLTVLGEGP